MGKFAKHLKYFKGSFSNAYHMTQIRFMQDYLSCEGTLYCVKNFSLLTKADYINPCLKIQICFNNLDFAF